MGPSGTGKTTLAMCTANAVDTNLYITTPSTFKDKDSVINFLFDSNFGPKIGEGDVLFIDEIHRLRESAAIYLYSAMQDFYIDVGGSVLELPKFTVIGATTDSGMMAAPFRDRFKVKLTLSTYNINDIADIIIDFKNIQKDIALELAKRSCGVPRIAKSLSDNISAYKDANNIAELTLDHVDYICDLLGIDKNGLNQSARKIVLYFQNNQNKPTGINSLATTLNISKETIQYEIFPTLFNLGLLISNGTRGKSLSENGLKYRLGCN